MDYQRLNAEIISKWCQEGWEWGQPVSHEVYTNATQGQWGVYLTPTKIVPHDWFGDLKGKKVLGLASGGGQQMPIFTALGAECTLLDYSDAQCNSERLVAQREGYRIEILQADMTKPLPFPDESFDLIFHPVSNCYVEEVEPIFKECYRILKKGGIFITQQVGADNDRELVKLLLGDMPLPFPNQYLDIVKKDFKENGFEIISSGECYKSIRFFDVGALVWFARIIEWEFVGFSVDACGDALAKAHEICVKNGFVEGKTHRFFLVAKKK